MTTQSIGIIGATSLVGQCLIQQGIAQKHHITAFSRRLLTNQNQPYVTWQQLPPAAQKETDRDIKKILFWIFVAPIWVLPGYFDFLLTFKPQRIVVLSSTSRFTKQNSSDLNEQVIAQKLADGEALLESWANLNKIEWIILRPTLIYGYGQDKNVAEITRFIHRYGFFPILGKASGLRQPIHSNDVATACLLALWKRSLSNLSYNITGDETLSYRQMIERIFVALNITPRIITLPLWVFYAAVWLLKRLPRFQHWNTSMATRMNEDLIFDHSEAKCDLYFSPKPFVLEMKDLPSQNP
ncbi:nucleoside-diphosphate-sugar epimerase [Nitrosomonas sp. PY1]|nr:nucleoside-diphosphate-sugar epimerase [Nitrosomonas sp. PY1]